jgi:hypothetical protein
MEFAMNVVLEEENPSKLSDAVVRLIEALRPEDRLQVLTQLKKLGTFAGCGIHICRKIHHRHL